METNHTSQTMTELETLIRNLRTEDARNLRMTRNFQSIMWAMLIIYALIFIVDFDLYSPTPENLGFLFFALAFLSFALLFRKYYKEYQSVDYGLPTVEMLNKAAKRYQLWHGRLLIVFIPVLLIGVAVGFTMQKMVPNPDLLVRIAIIQAIYYSILFVSFTVGYFIWRKRQKPLRDSALTLLREIES